jgi:hypothetical protein
MPGSDWFCSIRGDYQITLILQNQSEPGIEGIILVKTSTKIPHDPAKKKTSKKHRNYSLA